MTSDKGALSKPTLIEDRFRSRLEERIADQIEKSGQPFGYETIKVNYIVPSRSAKYTPDFILLENGEPKIYIEAKGRFRTTAERQKMVLVKDQNELLDIRFVFQNAQLPIYKGSSTTHGQWADAHGFKWADKGIIPTEWLQEIKKGLL